MAPSRDMSGTGVDDGVPPGAVQAGSTTSQPDRAHDATSETAAAKRLKPPVRRALLAAGVVIVLVAVSLGVAYFLHTRQFVTTDNAQIDGDQIQINAPATGTVIDWRATEGAQVHRDQIVGRILLQGSGAQPQQVIRAPADGTIAANPTVEGQWVTAGTNLATAYNGGATYVTARVDETDIEGVHVGAPVDISVDAYSNIPVTGIVEEIQDAAAAEFSLFPESNSDGNFQKVTQVIPVKIALTSTGGAPLAPGMNVTVHIHKH